MYPKLRFQNSVSRRGFTLMELLIVILIITILASLALFALAGAAEDARVDRTRSIVVKLDQLVMERYDGYRTRALPMRLPVTIAGNPRTAAAIRLAGMRDLQRMELPDRKSDVIDPPADIDPRVGEYWYLSSGATANQSITLQRAYRRKALQATGGNLNNWTETSQGAECLFLIVSSLQDGDKNALDFFSPTEIGDLDEDGMREILDGWGRPIEFIRWPSGFLPNQGPDGQWGIAGVDDDGNGTTDDISEAGLAGDDRQPLTQQTLAMRDPFDPINVDPTSFSLKPLIFSSGRDKQFDVFSDNLLPNPFHHYCPPATDNNFPQPYALFADGFRPGAVFDRDADGYETWQDNITNHYQPQN